MVIVTLDLSTKRLKNVEKSSKTKINKIVNINNNGNMKKTFLKKIILVKKINSKIYKQKIYKKPIIDLRYSR